MKLRILTAALLASLMALASLIATGCDREARDDVSSQPETGHPPGVPPVDADATAATSRPDSEPLEGYCDGLCCWGMHTFGPANCQECKVETDLPIHALCATCAKRGNRCTHCMKPIRK